MPIGQRVHNVLASGSFADGSPAGDQDVQMSFKYYKNLGRFRIPAGGTVQLPDCPCAYVELSNPPTNDDIYVGSIGDDAPAIDLGYSGDHYGQPVWPGIVKPFPVENSNRILVAGTANQEFYAMAYANTPDDFTVSKSVLTQLDTTPPTVLSTSPSNGATGVATNSAIFAIMSEAIDPTSVILGTSVIVAPATAGSAFIDSVNTAKIVFLPNANLTTNTVYTITLKSGASPIKDLAGNALAADSSFSFTTAAGVPPPDTTPPTITSFNPADTATGVALSVQPQIVFSEAMLSSTINTTNIQLLNAVNATVPITVTLGVDQKTVTIQLNSTLSYSTTYTIKVTTGVKDVAGNAKAAQQTASFTTLAPSYTLVYNYSSTNSWGDLDDQRTAAGAKLLSSSDPMYNVALKKIQVTMMKHGSPNQTVKVTIRNSAGTLKATFAQTMSSTSITTNSSGASYTFEDASQTYLFQVNDSIFIEMTGGTSSNYISVKRNGGNPWSGGISSNFDGTQVREVSGYDLAGSIWK